MDEDNIPTLLSEIKAKTGYSESRIGELIGVSQPTVNRILNGQVECKVKTWRAIMALHAESTAATPPHEKSNEEIRREVDLGYRQPADPQKDAA
jgi:predicted transcriptional regulator